jgi:hypothetical protein
MMVSSLLKEQVFHSFVQQVGCVLEDQHLKSNLALVGNGQKLEFLPVLLVMPEELVFLETKRNSHVLRE